jgi:hypothetical protein
MLRSIFGSVSTLVSHACVLQTGLATKALLPCMLVRRPVKTVQEELQDEFGEENDEEDPVERHSS